MILPHLSLHGRLHIGIDLRRWCLFLRHTNHKQKILTVTEDLQTSVDYCQVAGMCVDIPW